LAFELPAYKQRNKKLQDMHTNSASAIFWRSALLMTAVLMTGLHVMGTLQWRRSIDPVVAGTLGVSLSLPGVERGQRVISLAPDSPLAAKGVRSGEIITFDRMADRSRRLGTDEMIGLRVSGESGQVHLFVRPAPRADVLASPRLATATYVMRRVGVLFAIAIGLLIGWRRVGSVPVRTLAFIFLIFGFGQNADLLPAGPLSEFLYQDVKVFSFTFNYLAFLYFALAFPEERAHLRHPFVRRIFRAYLVFGTLFASSGFLLRHVVLPWPWLTEATIQPIANTFAITTVIAAFLAIWMSWYRASGQSRQRIFWVGLCCLAVFGNYQIANINQLLGSLIPPNTMEIFHSPIYIAGYLGLAYALLRHRVFDVSLAINRTLVFSATSVLLILVFFLLERLAHEYLHIEGAENNALVSGMIAFALFFTFNRLHHRVDHIVEKWLFHSWHSNTAALKIFVRKAGYFNEPGSLLHALGSELDRFTKNAGHALYCVEGGSTAERFVRVESTLPNAPATLDNDHSIAVTLRAERSHGELSDVSWAGPGGLALPILQGANLYGIAVLGTKANDNLYRPDEVEALAFAVTQAGFVLFALRMKQLEAEHLELQRRSEFDLARLQTALRDADAMRVAAGVAPIHQTS
jgi:hypothetical protein